MKIRVLAVLLLLIIGFSGVVKAQSDPVLDRLQVDIWPEYDRSDVLIIYRISLSSETSPPVAMSVRIPRAAGKPHALSMEGVDGLLYNLDYTITVEGEWLNVSFTTLSPEVHLEYYDPRLSRNGNLRSFEYLWPGDYTVNEMVIQIQQPSESENLETLPEAGLDREGEDGLTYYSVVVGSIDAGTPFTIGVTYQKSTDALSQSLQPVQPVDPIMPQTLGWATFLEVLPWALGVFGVLLIVVGGFWYWQSGHKVHNPIPRFLASAGNKEEAELDEKSASYCFECGKREMPGDIYCRSCGSKLHHRAG